MRYLIGKVQNDGTYYSKERNAFVSKLESPTNYKTQKEAGEQVLKLLNEFGTRFVVYNEKGVAPERINKKILGMVK